MKKEKDFLKEFEGISTQELENEVKKKIESFESLLDSLSSLHDKKKILWAEVHKNALTDRRNAYIMFSDLYTMVHNDNAQHALHGMTLTKYLERMSKANDQLIKLAEILDEAIEEDEEIDPDQIYEHLQNTESLKKGK